MLNFKLGNEMERLQFLANHERGRKRMNLETLTGIEPVPSVHRSGNLTTMPRKTPEALGYMLCSVMTHVLHAARITEQCRKRRPV